MEPALSSVIHYVKWVMLVPLVVGILRWRTLALNQKLLVGLAFCSFLTEIIADLFVTWTGNNMGVYHFYTLFEFVIIILVFHYGYERFLNQKVLIGLVVVFLGVWALESWNTKLLAFNSLSTTLEGIILIILSISFFAVTFRRLDIPNLSSHPIFWVGAGILIYFSSNFLLFAYHELLVRVTEKLGPENQSYFEIWFIHSFMNIALNLFYTRSLLCQWRESK